MLGRARSAVDQATLDRLVVVGLVVLAALLRFVDLPTRGTWDADQGNDMLVLRALVHDGRLPLLGPPTSIGDFHHGVLYYYLLAPAAALTGADPLAVVASIALAGVLAVPVTWWLARSIGGPVAGAVAGLLMAVSASAIDESTFIWNPNLIALSSSVALAGAWRAWSSGRGRWWIVAALGAIVTMHCHVLGVILAPAIAALFVADIRRRPSGPDRAERLRLLAVAGGLLVASYVPLAIHELTHDFSETRAALDFVAGGGEGSAVSPPVRFVIVGLRVLAWPLTGLVTAAPAAALLAAAMVIAFASWRALRGAGPERTAARWFGLTLAWTVVALTFAASGLATVIPGLPNDHYHAFADPIVFVVVGLGCAGLWRLRTAGEGSMWAGRMAATAIVVALVAFNVATLPPARHPDGGWPAARAAGDRIIAVTGTADAIVLDSLPVFKPPNAVRFPLVASGADTRIAAGVAGWDGGRADGVAPDRLVILCDELFATAIGADCGGPAEEARLAARPFSLADRFEAAPGRWISVYLPR